MQRFPLSLTDAVCSVAQRVQDFFDVDGVKHHSNTPIPCLAVLSI